MSEVAVGNVDSVLAEVRDLARTLIAPGAAEIDHESRFPDEQLSALGRVGALGLLVPGDQGGVGAGLVALAGACEAVGGACASTGMVFLMHSVTAATIAGGGGPSAPHCWRAWRPARCWARWHSASGAPAHISTPPSCGPSVVTARFA